MKEDFLHLIEVYGIIYKSGLAMTLHPENHEKYFNMKYSQVRKL